MKYFLLIILFLPIFLHAQMKHRTETILLMGSRFEITPFANSDSLVEKAIEATIAEIKRIENLISEWIPESEISKVNKNSGIKPVKVSKELFELVRRCLKVSNLTDGAFDISWAAARNTWKFDGSMNTLPSQQTLDSIAALINYKNIILNESDTSIFLSKKGMAIGLGSIGKGYAANRSKMIMKKMGVENGIVICGGDLIAWGTPDSNKLWNIGIANPSNPQHAIAWFEIGPMAVVTSGDYEHYVEFNGIRYSHIINPKTASPVINDLRSVTIIGPDAELSDALSTSVYVLGKEKGLELINQLKGIECIIIDKNFKFYSSKNIKLNFYGENEKQKDHFITIKK